MRKAIRPIIIFLVSTLCWGLVPTHAIYDLNSNVLSIDFDESILTGEVLLGLLEFTGGNESIVLTGGTILADTEVATTLDISLIYGQVMDMRADPDDATISYNYWGNTNDLADNVEAILNNGLTLNVSSGAFISSDYVLSSAHSLSVSLINTDDNCPNALSTTYDASNNSLFIQFDRPVQFDQLAEDRTCNGGQDECPGNGAMDGFPSEDTNNNGVLDMEANIDIFKVGFSSALGFIFLEGFNNLGDDDIEDKDNLTIFLTRTNSKKLEQEIIADDLVLTLAPGGFVDTFYNPNTIDTVMVTVLPDPIDLDVTAAEYDLGLNQLSLTYADSRDLSFSPAPIYTKITLSTPYSSHTLAGMKEKSVLGKTLILKEFLLADQTVIEEMIMALNPGDELLVSMDAYTLYDENQNGNMELVDFPVDIVGDYNNPEIDDVFYDATMNRVVLDWGIRFVEPEDTVGVNDEVNYYFTNQLIAADKDLYSVTGITFTNTTTSTVIPITSAEFSRSGDKTQTYLTLSMADAGIFEELFAAGNTIQIHVDPYTFFSAGSTDNNGNHVIDEDISYSYDLAGPAILSARLELSNRYLVLELDKNTVQESIDLTQLDLRINGEPYTTSAFDLLDPGVSYDDLIWVQFTEEGFDELISNIPENEFLNIQLNLEAGIMQNIDGNENLGFMDENGDGILNSEPWEDLGSDGLASPDEPGYPGDCSVTGICSDGQYLNQEDCEAAGACSDPTHQSQVACEDNVGTCSISRWRTRATCESHNGTWTPDPDAWETQIWTSYDSEIACVDGGAVWTPNLDPSNDDGITEGNLSYDPGEPFTDLNENGLWDEIAEPISVEFKVGNYLYNESHRAFADPPGLMYFLKKYENEVVQVLVEEAVLEGRCHNDDREREADCIIPNTEWINGRCIYIGVEDEETCLAKSEFAIWTEVMPEDVVSVGEFYTEHHETLENVYGELLDLDGNEKLTIVLYDISDEYEKGANDTNASLFTHGYFSLYDEPLPGINVGDILYLDIAPQVIAEDDLLLGTMHHALVHEFTKLLIEQHEPDEEPWLKEGLAMFAQKRILDSVSFFGTGTEPKVAAANQLTYISFSKRDRSDQHNIYLFLSYLSEKCIPADGNEWDIIDWIAGSETNGLASVQEGLDTLRIVKIGWDPLIDPTDTDSIRTVADVFIDYGTTCWLDVPNEAYQYRYTMDVVDLHNAPSSKNASVFTFDDARRPPYSKGLIQPWSFNFYLINGFVVSAVQGNIVIEKSELLNPYDEMVFDGFDGIDFRATKIMLKSGFTEVMYPDYEVMEFALEDSLSKGSLSVTTSDNFIFKDNEGKCATAHDDQGSCESAGFEWLWNGNLDSLHLGTCYDHSYTDKDSCEEDGLTWMWGGNMILALVVAKVDDTQPPNTYDFVITNITHPQDYSNFYVLQNQGIHNYLDLFVVSQRPIFDSFGLEGPEISIASLFDTTQVLMETATVETADYIMYHSAWQLGNWADYELSYAGFDQNGIPVEPDTIAIHTLYASDLLNREFVSADGQSSIFVPEAMPGNTRLTSYSVTHLNRPDIPNLPNGNLKIVSPVSYFNAGLFTTDDSYTIRFQLTEAPAEVAKIYTIRDGNWINLGGTLVDEQLSTATSDLGYFVVLAGQGHLPEQAIELTPDRFVLTANYPNPFNAATTFQYYLPSDGPVEIQVFNILGQQIVTLVNEYQPADWYTVHWRGLDQSGLPVPSGVYFLQVDAKGISETQKMVLMK